MMPVDSATGSLWLLFLYDVSEEIRLDELRRRLNLEQPSRGPSFRHPAPEYVRFEKPPVIENASPILLENGQKAEARVNYYEYGVISIALRLSFSCGWPELIKLVNHWIASPELLNRMDKLLGQHLERAGPALVDPYPTHLSEDYCVVHLRQASEGEGSRLSAAHLISSHGSEIAQIVRGESLPLSEEEKCEILQSRMSYYPDDLLVIGWTTAFIYDSAEGATSTLQLLEYANSQLLDFRHYDDLLTRVLQDVYRLLERESSFLFRWRLAHEAEKLNKLRLDIEELTERMDNSIKFLSDMFSARMYRLAAAKVGVLDYRRLVDDKLKTAGDLYRFMMDQFHESRAFVMELLIIIILLIDLVFLFRGKS